jgi:hypothetical protein
MKNKIMVTQRNIKYVKNNEMLSTQNDERCYKTLHMTSQHKLNIQSVPGRKVHFLGGHSIGHSKQKCLYERVLLRSVSEIQPFDCIEVWLGRPVLSFPHAMLRHCLKHVNLCEASVALLLMVEFSNIYYKLYQLSPEQ